MLLKNKYIGKDVKIIVSSQSGASISAGDKAISSTLTFSGKMVNADMYFIQLENAELTSANIMGNNEENGLVKSEFYESVLISMNNIIAMMEVK